MVSSASLAFAQDAFQYSSTRLIACHIGVIPFGRSMDRLVSFGPSSRARLLLLQCLQHLHPVFIKILSANFNLTVLSISISTLETTDPTLHRWCVLWSTQ